MKSKLVALTIISCYALIATADAKFDKNWRDNYTPNHNWQADCAYETRGASCPASLTYYYSGSNDDGVIVTLTSQRNWHNLEVAAYGGDCNGGVVQLDGKQIFALQQSRNGCEPADGIKFQDPGSPQSTRKTLSVGLLENADEMSIEMEMKIGEKKAFIIPLNTFSAALARARVIGSRGGRR